MAQLPEELYYELGDASYLVMADGGVRIVRPNDDPTADIWLILPPEIVFALYCLFKLPGVRPIVEREHYVRQRERHRQHIATVRNWKRGTRPIATRQNGKGERT